MKPIIMDDVDAVRADLDRARAEETPRKLAVEFSKIIRRWLTPLQLSQVVIMNRKNPNKNICATHEFCDANVAMDEAFAIVTGQPASADLNDETTLELWVKAWQIAQDEGFHPGLPQNQAQAKTKAKKS